MKNKIVTKRDANVTDYCKEKEPRNVLPSGLLQITPCKAELISLFAEKEVREAELMIESFLYSL